MNESVPVITNPNRRRLVEYHVHDVLRHKREVSHGHARMIFEKTQTGGRCGNAGGDLSFWWDSDRFDQPNLSGRREIVHSLGSGTVGVTDCFGCGLFNAKWGHGWRVMENDFSLRGTTALKWRSRKVAFNIQSILMLATTKNWTQAWN